MSFELTLKDNGTSDWAVYYGDNSTNIQCQNGDNGRTYFMYGNGGNSGTGYVSMEFTDKTVLLQRKNELYKDGNHLITFGNVTFASTNPLCLSSINISGNYTSKMFIYSFKLYNANDELIMSLIPVRKQDTPTSLPTVCMYDTISGTYFYNGGTGSFIEGPEV